MTACVQAVQSCQEATLSSDWHALKSKRNVLIKKVLYSHKIRGASCPLQTSLRAYAAHLSR